MALRRLSCQDQKNLATEERNGDTSEVRIYRLASINRSHHQHFYDRRAVPGKARSPGSWRRYLPGDSFVRSFFFSGVFRA